MKLYNTLSKKVEEFSPIDSKEVRMYTCGPTVYDYTHIGNFRSYIFAGVIFQTLKMLYPHVRWVMNLTDVDDKTIRKTVAEFGETANSKHLASVTQKYIDIFLEELQSLNIDPKQIDIIKVSDVIPEIQLFIQKLLDKGYAYKTEDGVFFSIVKYQEVFGDYGQLVGQGFLQGKKVGARVKVDEYEKDDLSDFALWKAQDEKDADIFWESETLGKGRPGWHIECSAINEKGFSGAGVDLHTGGVDLVFPHHTNEIAQSKPLYEPFVNYWLHCEHLQVDGKKMAKSAKNFFTLKDLVEKNPNNVLAFRYLCLQTDFRKSMNFTWESLEGARTALHRLYAKVDELKNADLQTPGNVDDLSEYLESFKTALADNLNVPKALALVWDILGDSALTPATKIDLIKQADLVLGLDLLKERNVEIPQEVQTLLNERQRARDTKNFAKSDELRDQIQELGFEVKDSKDGQKVNRI